MRGSLNINDTLNCVKGKRLQPSLCEFSPEAISFNDDVVLAAMRVWFSLKGSLIYLFLFQHSFCFDAFSGLWTVHVFLSYTVM